jgi:hypothetical protein
LRRAFVAPFALAVRSSSGEEGFDSIGYSANADGSIARTRTLIISSADFMTSSACAE